MRNKTSHYGRLLDFSFTQSCAYRTHEKTFQFDYTITFRCLRDAVKERNVASTEKMGSTPGDLQVTFISDGARNACWACLSHVTFMSHARVFLIELTHVRAVIHRWILWKWKRVCVCSISPWRKWKRKQSQPNQNQVTLLSRPRLTFTAFPWLHARALQQGRSMQLRSAI